MTNRTAATPTAGQKDGANWARAMRTGGRLATMDPRVGMKLRTKASRPQVKANSTPIQARTPQTTSPVTREMTKSAPR